MPANHFAASTRLALSLGALIAISADLTKLITHIPATKGDTLHVPEIELDLTAHLPTDKSDFSYLVSFTTPP
jgi:carbonic anhydrase